MKIIKKIKKWLWWRGITAKDLIQGGSAMLLLMAGLAILIYLMTLNVFS